MDSPGTRKAPSRFSRYRHRATKLASSPDDVRALAGAAANKLANAGDLPARFRAVRAELATFIALLKAWVNGDYRDVSTRTVITIIAAVLYFVVPFDLIPDFIVAIGLLDDAAVIGYVISVVRDEIAEFERWRRRRAGASDGGSHGGSHGGSDGGPDGSLDGGSDGKDGGSDCVPDGKDRGSGCGSDGNPEDGPDGAPDCVPNGNPKDTA